MDRRRSEQNRDPSYFCSAPVALRSRRSLRLSRHQMQTAMRIAAVPDKDFEAFIESPRPPGTTFLSQIVRLNRRHAGECLRNGRPRSQRNQVCLSILRFLATLEAFSGGREAEKTSKNREVRTICGSPRNFEIGPKGQDPPIVAAALTMFPEAPAVGFQSLR